MKHQMYATVRRYEGVADTESAALQVERKFVPLISALPGFIEYYWIDLGGGAMISVSIFKSMAEALHANNQSRVWVQDHLRGVLPPAVRIEAGTIVAHKGSL